MDTADSVNTLKIWDKNPNSSLPNGTSRFHFLINDAEKQLTSLTIQKKNVVILEMELVFFGIVQRPKQYLLLVPTVHQCQ